MKKVLLLSLFIGLSALQAAPDEEFEQVFGPQAVR
jgi:hypothetical protein